MMTIPQLRSSFEQIDKIAMELKGKDKDVQVKEFKKAWKDIFSRDVSPKAVESYLAVKHAEKRETRRRSRASKKQTGGMLSGAPLSGGEVRPGVYGAHGTFPAYVSAGLTPFSQSTNQIGGNFGDILSARIVPSASPPNFINTIGRIFSGQVPPTQAHYAGHTIEQPAWTARQV